MRNVDEPRAKHQGDGAAGIRPAGIRDIKALERLEREAFVHDRLSQRSFRTLLRKPDTASCFVAEGRGELLGYCLILFRTTARSARLYSIAVQGQAQGRGVARALLAAAEREARLKGKARMRLEVRADNGTALRLYGTAGYREVGRRPDYYEDDGEAVLMDKPLAGTPTL